MTYIFKRLTEFMNDFFLFFIFKLIAVCQYIIIMCVDKKFKFFIVFMLFYRSNSIVAQNKIQIFHFLLKMASLQ